MWPASSRITALCQATIRSCPCPVITGYSENSLDRTSPAIMRSKTARAVARACSGSASSNQSCPSTSASVHPMSSQPLRLISSIRPSRPRTRNIVLATSR